MENILVPLDFSEESINALNIADQIAKKGKAKIVLSHTIEIPDYLDPSSELNNTYMTELVKTVRNKVSLILKNEDITIPEESIDIETGHPFQHILELKKRRKINLVVMGSKGSRSWQNPMIGSNVEKMVRHTTCPVLIVKDRIDLNEVKDIAFATNLSNTPRYVIDALQDLQQLLKAKLHILKVVTPNNWATDLEIKEQMEEFVKIHSLSNYSMDSYNDVDAEDGIIHYASMINAGLIALSSHTKIHIPSIINDNRITERVVENSKQLVWTCGLGTGNQFAG